MGCREWIVVLALGLFAQAGWAGSGLRLEPFGTLGVRHAVVYDEAGSAVGRSVLRFEQGAEGRYRLRVETELDRGESSSLEALLAPHAAGGLVLLTERSRTFDARGRPTVAANIDHERGLAVCTQADGTRQEILLPEGERVANVAVPLLLLPIARGEREEVSFQFVLCRQAPRILDATARIARSLGSEGGAAGVEIATSFELGPVLTALAGPFLPRTVFWLDPDAKPAWLGHHMPLYPGGPELSIVREGVPGGLVGLEAN